MTRPSSMRERRLLCVRDALAGDDAMRAVVAVSLLAEGASSLTPVEVVDTFERICANGSLSLVEYATCALGPIPYRGWALAFALRCAHEDVARYLLATGADLLEDVPADLKRRSVYDQTTSPSRLDLTRESPRLLRDPYARSVASEVFSPFTGNEQLLGGTFSAPVDRRATCDLVALLAEEGAFDPVAFDDLTRAALAAANEELGRAAGCEHDAVEACLALVRRMIGLRRAGRGGSDRLREVVADFVDPRTRPEVMAFVCQTAPAVFVSCIATSPWLRDDPARVREMVPSLSPVDAVTARPLVMLLARNGFMTELEIVSRWPEALDAANLDEAIAEASAAGRAEAAAWLVGRRHALDAATGSTDLDDLLL